MGRPVKKGLDYFPVDVDIFQDIKVRKLIRYQGAKAFSVYIYLLSIIYRDGYYFKWDEFLPFTIAESTGCVEAYVREVIECCFKVDLLSRPQFQANAILTSRAIQERYVEINTSMRRSAVVSEYSLVDDLFKPSNNANHPAKPEDKRRGVQAAPAQPEAYDMPF